MTKLKWKNFRVFAFAVIWVFWEWFKSTGFLAYPWGTISMTVYAASWLKQIADITGVWGISFVVAFCSATIAEVLPIVFKIVSLLSNKEYNGVQVISKKQELKKYSNNLLHILGAGLFLVFLCSMYSFAQIRKPIKKVNSLKIALVQPNTNSWETGSLNQLEKIISLTENLLANANQVDLIVWNEGSLVYSYPLNLEYYKTQPENYSFAEFMAKNQTPLLVGTSMPVKSVGGSGVQYFKVNEPFVYDYHAMNFFANSVCLISPDLSILDFYNKMHLVPFAEDMPFIENEIIRNVFRKLVGFSSAYLSGKELKILSVNKKDGSLIRFAAPICFEDAFPRLCAILNNLGSQLLINLTDDSWSQTKSAEYQHFVVASFRAIELRTTLIRSTNSGYSCVVNPKGVVTSDLPLFSSGGLYVDVPIYENKTTFYAKFKDWLPLACYALILGFALYKSKTIKKIITGI